MNDFRSLFYSVAALVWIFVLIPSYHGGENNSIPENIEALERYARSQLDFNWGAPTPEMAQMDPLVIARRDIAREEIIAGYAREANLDQQPEIAASLAEAELRVAEEVAQQWLRENVSVSDEEVRHRYEEEGDKHRRPARARFQFLFERVIDQDDGDAALERLQELQQRISEGEPFHILVMKQEGLDPAQHGEESVTLSARPGQYSDVIDEAVFSLPTGEVSEPIRGPHGWYLFLIVERTEEMRLPFEDREDLIRNQILSERRGQLRQEVDARLRERFPLKWVGGTDSRIQEEVESGNDIIIATLEDWEITRAQTRRHLVYSSAEAGENEWRDAVEIYATPIRLLLWATEEGWTEGSYFKQRLSQRRNQILALAYRDNRIQDIEITEQAIKEFHEEHEDSYVMPEHYKVMEYFHPAPTREQISSPADLYIAREGTKKLMIEIAARLKDGESVDDVLDDLGEDGKGLVIRDLGWGPKGPRGRLVDTSISNLKAGEFSPVQESRHGFHIFKLEETRPPRLMTLEEARDRVYRSLSIILSRAALDEFVAEVDRKIAESD